LGTALAPVLVAIVVGLGAWWLLPVVVACIMILIFGIALTEPLSASARAAGAGAPTPIGLRNLPDRFWFYATAVFLYGILETLNGNWATLYLIGERGVSARGAAFALAAFWAMVTVGRVLSAVISQAVPARWIYATLPILLLIVFQVSSRVQDETWGIVVFGLAGLACSAFLPLSISFGGDEFPSLSAVMAGELIAFYQVGYGVAAFGTGPLRDMVGLPYSMIFAAGSIVAVPLIVVAWFVSRRPLAA
jgi:MFS transporter, FHS family, glucose/mannose:H+ symporter